MICSSFRLGGFDRRSFVTLEASSMFFVLIIRTVAVSAMMWLLIMILRLSFSI